MRMIDTDAFSLALIEWQRSLDLDQAAVIDGVLSRMNRAAVIPTEVPVMESKEEKGYFFEGIRINPMVKIYTCGNCLRKVEKGWLFCPSCGKQLKWR